MSRQVRFRVAALALGGLLLGVPLLTNGSASAEQVPTGGRQVVFSGGDVLGLSCRSQPSVESMTVPSNSTIRIVNHTGHSALLQLGGASKGTLGDGRSAEVVFRRGTTAVLLSPSCALGDESTPLLVTAMPTDPAAMPDPVPAQSDQADVPAAPTDSDSPSTPAPGSALPDAVTPGQPQRPPLASGPGAIRTTGAQPSAAIAAATATEAMPQGGSAPRFNPRTPTGTTSATAPAFAGMPPGEHKTLLPGVPSIGLSQVTDPPPANSAVPSTQPAAAEPVAAIKPLPDTGRIGLLALIAIVCVLGVAAGVIRAFVSQRASRTKVA